MVLLVFDTLAELLELLLLLLGFVAALVGDALGFDCCLKKLEANGLFAFG